MTLALFLIITAASAQLFEENEVQTPRLRGNTPDPEEAHEGDDGQLQDGEDASDAESWASMRKLLGSDSERDSESDNERDDDDDDDGVDEKSVMFPGMFGEM